MNMPTDKPPRGPGDQPPNSGDKQPENNAEGTKNLWRRFDDYDGLSSAEREKLVDDLCAQSGIGRRRAGQGYDYIITNEDAFTESFVLGSSLMTIEYGERRNRKIDPNDDAARTAAIRQEVKVEEARIMSEFKIHLQPSRDRIGLVVRRLTDTLTDPKNQDLREALMGFKIRRPPGAAAKDQTKIMPEIVIYPRVGTGSTPEELSRARANAEIALAKVTAATQDLVGLGQRDRTPRYNARINDLVYIAQSSGDFKEFLEREGLLDEFFDPETNYAYRYGERPLDRPVGASETADRRREGPDWLALRELEEDAQGALDRLAQENHEPLEIRTLIYRLDLGIARARAEAKSFYDTFDKLDRASLDRAVIERKGSSAILDRLQTLHDRLRTSVARDQLNGPEDGHTEPEPAVKTERQKDSVLKRMIGWFRRKK